MAAQAAATDNSGLEGGGGTVGDEGNDDEEECIFVTRACGKGLRLKVRCIINSAEIVSDD